MRWSPLAPNDVIRRECTIRHNPCYLTLRTTDAGAMGIRYYALAVPPHLLERASASLPDFLASHPWGDPDDPENEGPLSLDLDKCWREFQVIFGPPESPSAAFELVRGDVTHTDAGWIPFQRFLDADQVQRVARDLADIDECFVMDRLSANRVRPHEEFEREVDYALRFLDAAGSFAQQLAASGSGLIYRIG